MCGITGKVHFERQNHVSIYELKTMTDSIFSRGPDDEGHYIDGNIGLGFRRLSIIDLKTGHQPLSNKDRSIFITFNGEIYNYLELKKGLINKGYCFQTQTDTEVIVNLYSEYGPQCVKYLRGMFSFVIFDKRQNLLFGARDRFGIKPFHYYIDGKQFIWGSEIKSIIKAKGLPPQINNSAINHYFTYGCIEGTETIYKNISRLLPGHYFTLDINDNNSFKIVRYWHSRFSPDYKIKPEEWIDQLQHVLNESVKIRLMSDVPLGALLSGGIDSSAVVAYMARFSSNPIKTFSIGFKNEKYNELEYARAIAQKYHTEHHEMIVEPESISLLPKLVEYFDEPFADSSAIPTYYVSKFAREYVTVVLSGDGGDELFAGYNEFTRMMNIFNNPLNTPLFNYSSKLVNKIIPDYFYGKGLSYLYSNDKNNIAAFFSRWRNYERKKLFTTDFQRQFELDRPEKYHIELLNGNSSNGEKLSAFQNLWIKTYLVDDILTKVDRASMLNSLEVRVPILDHEFAELTFRIPAYYKINNDQKKYIFKESIKNIIPKTVFNHKKQGFSVPLEEWFKDDLKEYMFSFLNNQNLQIFEYLNYPYVQSILEYHQKGFRNYSNKIWSILWFNEWLLQN